MHASALCLTRALAFVQLLPAAAGPVGHHGDGEEQPLLPRQVEFAPHVCVHIGVYFKYLHMIGVYLCICRRIIHMCLYMWSSICLYIHI